MIKTPQETLKICLCYENDNQNFFDIWANFSKGMRAQRPSVVLALGLLLSSSQVGFAQENYVPPVYRESVYVPMQVSNLSPSDQVFDIALGDAPREPEHPFFDVDWSVLLSGTHTGGTDTGKNFVTLAPEMSLTHMGLRGQYVFDATTTFSVNDDQLTRVNDGEFGYSAIYELDAVTQFNANANIKMSQDDVNAPGTSDTIVQTPYEVDLQGELGFLRQFGKVGADLRINGGRRYLGDTQLVGDVAMSNSERSYVQAGTSLRLSYAFSPEISVYIQGDATRDWYDAAPVSTGVLLDGVDYGVTAGATVNWRDVVDLGVSAGYVLRQHIDGSIAERGEAVYGVDIAYTPNDALSFEGAISTIIRPEDVTAGLLASVEYNATGSIAYAIAPWLDLRGTQTGNWVFPVLGVNTQTRFTSGIGVDVAVNKNLSINADYMYSWAEVLPSDEDPEWSHAATIGIRYSR